MKIDPSKLPIALYHSLLFSWYGIVGGKVDGGECHILWTVSIMPWAKIEVKNSTLFVYCDYAFRIVSFKGWFK